MILQISLLKQLWYMVVYSICIYNCGGLVVLLMYLYLYLYLWTVKIVVNTLTWE